MCYVGPRQKVATLLEVQEAAAAYFKTVWVYGETGHCKPHLVKDTLTDLYSDKNIDFVDFDYTKYICKNKPSVVKCAHVHARGITSAVNRAIKRTLRNTCVGVQNQMLITETKLH